ncbi:MAG: PhoH family protein [Gammaproteobacteria bacterium]
MSESVDLALEPEDNQRLANLCGPLDRNLRDIEQRLGVEINRRGNLFRVTGDRGQPALTGRVLTDLYGQAGRDLGGHEVHLAIHENSAGGNDSARVARDPATHADGAGDEVAMAGIRTRRGVIQGRGANQRDYIQRIRTHDLNFGIGPAGTGKTYLAVACAVEALEREEVRRLVLARPAVEAGERLGFLPGDLSQKVDPYLRPLYDALYEMLGFEKVNKLMERNVIEVAPLAFMRGRTLNEAYIILDEAQNTTLEQMKMFLTRLGFGSTAVVTGDITQVDLPRGQQSGLRHVTEVLNDVEGISFTFFKTADVVRHSLVQRIVAAYDGWNPAGVERHEPRGNPGSNPGSGHGA